MALPTAPDELLLLHNPRCSKSRATYSLLEERGVGFEVREYLEDPLTREELVDLAGRLGKPLSEWIRKREEPFVEAGLDPDSDPEALLRVVAEHPVCMERPILIRGSKARVGRPPEDVLALLD